MDDGDYCKIMVTSERALRNREEGRQGWPYGEEGVSVVAGVM